MSENCIKTQIGWNSSLEVNLSPLNFKKTSIICTIGPASCSPELIVQMREKGMNIARLNFSHGTHQLHGEYIEALRKSDAFYPHRPIAIALDTKGPEIRTGSIAPNVPFVEIKAGSTVIVTVDRARENSCDATGLFVDYPLIAEAVRETKKIFIADGVLCLEVEEFLKGGDLRCRARNSFRLTSKKGVNLPGASVNLPALSAKDVEDLKFAVEMGLDIIFASFIRKGSDVDEIRSLLLQCCPSKGKHMKIICKIESAEGIQNFDQILERSDGIMVARGDLGIEIAAEKVFVAQKMMIAKCNLAGKPAICATQMLESMISNPRPTRAEVSDVANAVLDGADCLMLSGESAGGNYPVEATEMMHKTIVEAESTISYLSVYEQLRNSVKHFSSTQILASSAVNASLSDEIQAIIVLTISGYTAQAVARFRPEVPILVVTRNAETARQLMLYRGCFAFYFPTKEKGLSDANQDRHWQSDVDNRIHWAIEQGKRMGLIVCGKHIVAIQGWKGGFGNTNTLRILPVSED